MTTSTILLIICNLLELHFVHWCAQTSQYASLVLTVHESYTEHFPVSLVVTKRNVKRMKVCHQGYWLLVSSVTGRVCHLKFDHPKFISKLTYFGRLMPSTIDNTANLDPPKLLVPQQILLYRDIILFGVCGGAVG